MPQKTIPRRECSQVVPLSESAKSFKLQRIVGKLRNKQVHLRGTGRDIAPENAPFRPWSAAILAARDANDDVRRRFLTALIRSLLDLRVQLSATEWDEVYTTVSIHAGVIRSLALEGSPEPPAAAPFAASAFAPYADAIAHVLLALATRESGEAGTAGEVR